MALGIYSPPSRSTTSIGHTYNHYKWLELVYNWFYCQFILPRLALYLAEQPNGKVGVSGVVRTKKGHRSKSATGPDKKKTPDGGDNRPVTLAKMYRGYSMTVRGEVPDDIVERISGLHSAALRDANRPENPRSEGVDSSKEEGH